MTSQIALLGLGNMGTALAQALLKAGKSIKVWNRSSSRPSIAALTSSGAIFEADVSTTLSQSEIIIICVLDYATIHKILQSVNKDIFKGKAIINLSSGTPAQSRALAAHLSSLDVKAYFAGGVMATPSMVATPASFLFLSGANEEQFVSIKSTVEIFGAIVYLGEDPGSASLHDLALLTGMYGMFAGAFTAMALLKKASGPEGVKGKIEAFFNPLLVALIPHLADMAGSFDSGVYEHMGHPVGMQNAILKNMANAFEDEGVDGGSLKHFSGVVDRVVREYGGDGGIARVAQLLLKD